MALKDEHAEITDCYYNKKEYKGKILTKGEFEKLHSINSLKREKDKLSKGNQIGLSQETIDARISDLEKG